MQWTSGGLKKYAQAKEYVDTLLIPLVPFQLSNDTLMLEKAFQREFLSLFSKEIERELTGRILLTPDYTYLSTTNKTIEINRINEWILDVQTQPFHHILFLTLDAGWKKHEQDLSGDLFWFLGMRKGDIHSKEMGVLIRDQVEQIIDLIRADWSL